MIIASPRSVSVDALPDVLRHGAYPNAMLKWAKENGDEWHYRIDLDVSGRR